VRLPSSATVGTSFTYTLTARSTGASPPGAAVLTDTLPQGVSFVSANAPPTSNTSGVLSFDLAAALASGNPATVTISVVPTAAGSLVNHAALVLSSGSAMVEKDTSQTTTAAAAVTPAADLAVTSAMASPAPSVAPGGRITFTSAIVNNGPDDATNVVGTVQVPARTRLVSFAAPAGVDDNAPAAGTEGPFTITVTAAAAPAGAAPQTFTLVVQADDDAPDGAVIASSAHVASDTGDANTGNNSGSASVTVVVPAAPAANLTLGNTAPGSATSGGNFSYTLTVGNAGPDADSGVVLTDTLPANVRVIALETSQGTIVLGAGNTVTANLGTIGVGATVTVTIMVQAVAPGSLVNTAIARSDLASVASASAQTQVSAAPSATSSPPPTGAAPRVIAVRRSGFHARPTVLTLSFSGELDPVRAQDLDVYQIVVPGLGRVALSAASYSASTHTVTLRPSVRINIHHPFSLMVVGSGPRGLGDTDGRRIDGTGTGQPGHDFTATIVGFGPGPLPTAAAAHALARPSVRALAVHDRRAHRRG
jgi:uncharacterized repeat protein (TIGR01451 family)